MRVRAAAIAAATAAAVVAGAVAVTSVVGGAGPSTTEQVLVASSTAGGAGSTSRSALPATPTATGTPAAATPSAVTAPLIPAASVLPTTVPTTVPTVAPTTASRPTGQPRPTAQPRPTGQPRPTVGPRLPVVRTGTFTVTEKVVKSNRSTVPVGRKSTFTWSLPVLCDPLCAATDPGGDVSVRGRTWRYSFTSETVCYRLTSAGKKYDKRKGTTTSAVVLTFSKPSAKKPQRFTGTVKQRLKKECRGYRGMWKPWSVDYALQGKLTGTTR